MAQPLQLASNDRVLVFAPHPDDETLAAGELIQLARSLGACVRIVFATDGENNPWPQRWLERRWRIGAAEHARWATRRRGEAAIALSTLGLDPARDACFLGWPDQSLTDVLMQDVQGVAVLAAELREFAPTHVVMPARGDRHPDHSALHVMLQLAMLDAGIDGTRLHFIVHGERAGLEVVDVPRDPAHMQRKLDALDAHASQTALSRRRLVGFAMRTEQYELDPRPHARGTTIATGERIDIPLRAGWPALGRHELLLVRHSGSGTLRWRARLPRHPGKTMSLRDSSGRILSAAWTGGAISLEVPLPTPACAIYAKFHRTGSRVVVYDREFWLDLTDPGLISCPPPSRTTASSTV